MNDIKEEELRNTGGGGMFADNWHVDKIYSGIADSGINKLF